MACLDCGRGQGRTTWLSHSADLSRAFYKGDLYLDGAGFDLDIRTRGSFQLR